MAEPPIFSLHGPEWTPSHSMGSITHLVVSHGNIFVGASSGKIMRLGIGTGEYEELDLPSAYRSHQVHAIFADVHSPSALLVALRPAETLYFHRGKGRQLGKAKGISVTSVAWMRCDASRPDVREVLLGSASGVIYEAAIEPQRTKYLRQLHALHPAQAVTGLQVRVGCGHIALRPPPCARLLALTWLVRPLSVRLSQCVPMWMMDGRRWSHFQRTPGVGSSWPPPRACSSNSRVAQASRPSLQNTVTSHRDRLLRFALLPATSARTLLVSHSRYEPALLHQLTANPGLHADFRGRHRSATGDHSAAQLPQRQHHCVCILLDDAFLLVLWQVCVCNTPLVRHMLLTCTPAAVCCWVRSGLLIRRSTTSASSSTHSRQPCLIQLALAPCHWALHSLSSTCLLDHV